MRRLTALLVALLLTACNLYRPGRVQETAPPTDTLDYHDCYYNWATQPLPDLSRQVQQAMEKAGLKGIKASAEAYGENCFDSQTNEVVSFSAMETDFKLSLEVPDLADTQALGDLVERILVVLDEFPTKSTPGPQPGYVGIHFGSGDQVLNLWFLIEKGKAARGEGLQGAALLEWLQKNGK